MRAYFIAGITSIMFAFLFGTIAFLIFGYNPLISLLENVSTIYQKSSFWIGLVIWTSLYFFFFALPVAFFRKKA